MKEPVGICVDCGKTVYCDGGFLNGTILKDHRLRCYDCEDEMIALKDPSISTDSERDNN